jgi:alkylation response protein AidB-like acyl-CoA dehydrogenase
MDLALDDQQEDLWAAYERFFRGESTMDRVRASGSTGLDQRLWADAVEGGLVAMGRIEANGGVSAVSLALVAELAGRHLVAAPVVEALCVVRLLDQLTAVSEHASAVPRSLLDEVLAGRVVSFAPNPLTSRSEHYVPVGGVATAVLGSWNDRLVVFDESARQRRFDLVHGSYPLGRWVLGGQVDHRVVLDRGGERWLSETSTLWRILTAAAMMGLGRRAIEIGAEYASTRRAFGTPIGAFQGVAHPLADSATDIDGGQLLVRRAAWLVDRGEMESAAYQATLAAGFCGAAATRATGRAVHVHGGYGAALDYDIQLFHQRARALQGILGDPDEQFRSAGARLIAAAQGAS